MRGGGWLGVTSALAKAVWRDKWDILQLLIDDPRVQPDGSFVESMWDRWSGLYFREHLEETFHRTKSGGQRNGFSMMYY
jgi:hypothetical protein